MMGLIIADQRRYMKKVMLYVLVLLCSIALFFIGSDVAEADYLKDNFNLYFTLIGSFVIPMYLVSMVFGDDLRYDITPAHLGAGMERRNLVLFKTLELFLNMAVIYALFFVIYMLRFAKNGVTPARSVVVEGLLEVLWVFLLAFGDLVFAQIFLYLTMNVVVGMISFLLFRAIGPSLIQSVEKVVKFNVHSFIYDGLVGDGINALEAGKFPWQLLVGIVVYVGGALLIAILVFDRKELDL